MDYRSYVKCKTTKLLEDNIGENLGDLGFGDKFLETTPKARSMKEKNSKFDFTKMKTCSVKCSVKRLKTQAEVWEKIFLKHFSDKGLVFNMSIYKNSYKSIYQTIKNGQNI